MLVVVLDVVLVVVLDVVLMVLGTSACTLLGPKPFDDRAIDCPALPIPYQQKVDRSGPNQISGRAQAKTDQFCKTISGLKPPNSSLHTGAYTPH